jgi:hypothetical protein
MRLVPEFFSISDLCKIPYIEETIEAEVRHVNESLSALGGSTESSDAPIILSA